MTTRPAHEPDEPSAASFAVDATGTSYSTAPADRRSRREVLEAEKARFGGIKFFTAFFGWLTATGLVVLMTAIVSGIGAAAGGLAGMRYHRKVDRAGFGADVPEPVDR